MSFELYGAIRSREFLNEQLAPRDLADGVAEVPAARMSARLTAQTINRHTDFVAGEATTHVQLIQLGTLFVRPTDRLCLTGRTITGCTPNGSQSRPSTRSSRRTRASAGTVRLLTRWLCSNSPRSAELRRRMGPDALQRASPRRWKMRSRRSRGASRCRQLRLKYAGRTRHASSPGFGTTAAATSSWRSTNSGDAQW